MVLILLISTWIIIGLAIMLTFHIKTLKSDTHYLTLNTEDIIAITFGAIVWPMSLGFIIVYHCDTFEIKLFKKPSKK